MLRDKPGSGLNRQLNKGLHTGSEFSGTGKIPIFFGNFPVSNFQDHPIPVPFISVIHQYKRVSSRLGGHILHEGSMSSLDLKLTDSRLLGCYALPSFLFPLLGCYAHPSFEFPLFSLQFSLNILFSFS